MKPPAPPHPTKRLPPNAYSVRDLEIMLVDDGTHHRPLGGSGEIGLQWMTTAIAIIGRERRQSAEDVFAGIVAQIGARTGHRWLAVV